jgi:hypothetical protein
MAHTEVKKMKVIVLLMILLVVVTMTTACKEPTQIKSEDQAVEETLNIGGDVDDVGALLDDIDEDLG